MNEFLRRAAQLAKSRRLTKPDGRIVPSTDEAAHRDERPGRYAVTGPFIKLPDSKECNTDGK